MSRPYDPAHDVNPHQERSLLSGPDTAAWSGFAMNWVEAGATAANGGHTVERSLLALIDSGTALASFGRGLKTSAHDLRPGATGVFAAGTHMDHCSWRCEGVRRIMVEVEFDRLSDHPLSEQFRRTPLETEFEFRDPELTALLYSMLREITAGSPNGRLFAESLSFGLALHLQQRAAARYHQPRERGRLSPPQLRRLEETIRAHLARDISLSMLAAAAGYSPSQFLRLFKNTLGCTPHQHVLKLRLAHARELVVGSDLPLALIANETGFASQSHMTSAFAQAFKTPPGEMRRSLRP